jgi:hypothetical protein
VTEKEKELQERVTDLEDILRVFSQYASDTWVREQAEEILGE